MVNLKRRYKVEMTLTCNGGELPEEVATHLAKLFTHSYLWHSTIRITEADEATEVGNKQKREVMKGENGESTDGNIASSDCLPASNSVDDDAT
jgi:hypothetical protein